MSKARSIQVTDVILRDAHQSLIATRMRTEDMLPICQQLDEIGTGRLKFGVVQPSMPVFDFSRKTLGSGCRSLGRHFRIRVYRCCSEVRICWAIDTTPMM
jgi:isopropylmalate/homocitrate/citramalate synthase